MRVALPALLVAGLVTVAALRVVEEQQTSLRALDSRFRARAESGANFIAAYVDDLADRQQELALRVLAAPEVDEHDFADVVAVLDLPDAVLADEQGEVLHEHGRPHVVSLLSNLRSDVSGVLTTTARGPVVAVAVSFGTPTGMRVLRGSYPVEGTPLGRFLDNSVPLAGAHAWLVDSRGRIVANRGAWDERAELRRAEPGLPVRVLATSSGDYEQSNERRRFAGAAVAGTPWRIVNTVPQDVLYGPVRNSQLVPRLTLLALFATALFALLLLWRVVRSEARLADAVRTDVLTGLPNRRSLEEHLLRMAAGAARQCRPVAVLVIDVDRFKQVNDTVGHVAGDQVLAACAERMTKDLRTGEVLGRWGGEEFLALLPDTTAEQARVAAERLRRAVHHPVLIGDRALAPSVSIGVATTVTDDAGAVLRAADAALYEAKAAGRNRVQVAASAVGAVTPLPVAHPVPT